jgi:MFS family permease
VASAACAFAPSVGLLVAARAVQALGAALVTPTSLSLLLAAYPAERRAHAVGAWASIGAIAAALGPPLGGVLVEASWHWVFLVNVPVGLVALVAGRRALPRVAPTGAAGRPDVLGTVGLFVGGGALAYALVRAPDLGWVSVPVTVGLAVAVLGLAGVVARSRRHPVPAIDLTVVRTPVVGLAALTMVAFTTGFAGMLVVNVLYLTGTWGWSAPAAGLALAVGPLVVVGVARLSGRLTGRFGIGPVAAVGGLFFAAGPAWWALHLGVEPDYALSKYLAGMLPGQIATGVGVGLMLPTLSSVVGSALPAHRWGSGSSLINTARQVGSVLGVALLVSVIGTHTTGRPEELGLVRDGWLLLTAAGVVAAVLALALARAERRPAAPQVVEVRSVGDCPAGRAG